MCRVFSCVVGRGCLLWPMCSLGKTLSHLCITSHLYLQSASLMSAYLWSGFLLTMPYAKLVLRTVVFYSIFWNDRIVFLLNRMMVLFFQINYYLSDTRQVSCATTACSSACYTPAEPRDTCLLICLILAIWAARHLPAHLPDTRKLSRATPYCSSAWYSPAEPPIPPRHLP